MDSSGGPTRPVAAVIPAIATYEGAGFLVHRPFPRPGFEMVDPFLLLDEMGPSEHAPGEAKGAPDHPHRGFETVTYVLDGAIEHKDSVGHVGHIGPGDVQWMTAGAGVVHSEMPAESIRRAGGRLHGVQLWVNLRASEKMVPARYQGLTRDEIPAVERDGVTVRVIAGTFGGESGVVEARSPITYMHATVPPGSSVRLPAPYGQNAFAYLVGGRARFGSEAVEAGHTQLVLFADGAGEVEVAVPATEAEPAEVLLLSGEPLGEPVARYGPFVMNTRAQILEAIEDYQAGRMGHIRV